MKRLYSKLLKVVLAMSLFVSVGCSSIMADLVEKNDGNRCASGDLQCKQKYRKLKGALGKSGW